MHGSLIDSHQRLSLSSTGPGILLSSSRHTLTDDEQTKSLSNARPSIDSSSMTRLKNAAVYVDNSVEANDEKTTQLSLRHSVNFFRWTPGYRHVMLTFATICLFAFMTGVEYAVILPTVYDYVRKMTNANIYVGLILSSYSISGSIAGIIMGKISDVTGKVKFLILIATVFEISGNILYFVANNIHIVLLGRLIAGVGMGVVPPILADVAHRTTESERTKAISVILGCRQFGLLIGPCFTLLIRLMNFRIGSIHVYNLNGPGFLMAIIWLFLIGVCWFCFYDRRSSIVESSVISKHTTKDSLQEKFTKSDHSLRQEGQCASLKVYFNQYIRIEMFVLFLATFITYFNQTALETIVAAFTEKNFYWTTVHTSILFAFAGLEIILVYVSLVKIFSKRVEDRILLIFGFVSLTLACILGALFTIGSRSFGWFSPSPTNSVNKTLLALFIVFVILDLLALPFIAATSVSLFTKLTIRQLQGFSQGLQRFTMGTGTIVGPLFASLLLNRLDIMMTSMFALTSLTLVAILIVLKRLRTTPPKSQSNEIKDANNNTNHPSSVEIDNNEQKTILLSKNCYVTLTQNDDEQNESSLENNHESVLPSKSVSTTTDERSHRDIQNQSNLNSANSMNNFCLSDQQNQTLNNSLNNKTD